MLRALTLLIMLGIAAIGCQPEPLHTPNVQVVSPVPTVDTTQPENLCSTVNASWGRDWLTAVRALESLAALQVVCADGVTIKSKLYTAYLAYGTALEERGLLDRSIDAYQQALVYDPLGAEAAARLKRLGVATPQPPEQCDPGVVVQAKELLSDYMPTRGAFVTIEGQRFVLDEAHFPVYGVNYYPRDTPFHRFLRETRLEVVSAELDIIQRAGFNTLRIFLRHDDLFTCPGSGAVPITERFQRLDGIIQAAAEKGLKLILVLNTDADLVQFPLYENLPYALEQTRFITARYKDEPAIMAWDLRDGGDNDYLNGDFPRDAVLQWLLNTGQEVRKIDQNHLITAGWWLDSGVTAPLVDFISFQHYGQFEDLRQNIAIYKNETNKPILLTSVGYSTFQLDETAQRNLLFQTFDEVRHNSLAGWIVYMAFDYPLSATCIEPDCPGEANAANFYGIWNTSYFPKLALDAVKRIIETE